MLEFLKPILSPLVTPKALIAALLIFVLVLRPFVMYTAVKDSEDKDAKTVGNMYIAIASMSILAVAMILFVMVRGVQSTGFQQYVPHVVLFMIFVCAVLQMANLGLLKKAGASELTFNATLDLLAAVYVAAVVYSFTTDEMAKARAASFGHFYY